ncbi:MAG: TRAP transporter small permease [Thermodesulfobacteriota bacterium]
MKSLDRIHRGLCLVAGIALAGMILITFGNILTRLIWKPIPGSVELTGYLSAIVAAFSLSFTQSRKGHIAVDILVNTLSNKPRAVIQLLSDLLCLGFSLLVGWQIWLRAVVLMRTGEVSETLQMIYYPFLLMTSIGFFSLGLTLLCDVSAALGSGRTGRQTT